MLFLAADDTGTCYKYASPKCRRDPTDTNPAMTRAEPNPLRFELLQSDDYAHYIQRDPREVRFILRNLIERRAMVSTYYGPTGDFLLTTVLGMSNDENSLYLDWGADENINARVAASDQLTCMTQLDRVKIQFPLQYAETIWPGGHESLCGAGAGRAVAPAASRVLSTCDPRHPRRQMQRRRPWRWRRTKLASTRR